MTVKSSKRLVGHADCAAFAGDLRTQLVSSLAADQTGHPVKPLLGFGELRRGGFSSFERRQPLLVEQPEPRSVALAELRPLDLDARPMLRPGRKWALIDGKALDRRLLERLRHAGHRIAVVELVELALT